MANSWLTISALLAATTGSTLSANGGTSAFPFCSVQYSNSPLAKMARVREGRHPAAILQARVPADMIDMQMRAHHDVDVRDGDAGRRQSLHIGVVGINVPFRPQRAGLVIA